jgi:hypothetical protein
MTAPNLKSPTTITGKTARYAVPLESNNAPVEMLAAPGTGKTFKINSIFCANVDGTNDADISVSIYNGTDYYLTKTLTVPAKATQIISSKETYFYLEEGDSIRASASAVDDLQLVIGYEEIE